MRNGPVPDGERPALDDHRDVCDKPAVDVPQRQAAAGADLELRERGLEVLDENRSDNHSAKTAVRKVVAPCTRDDPLFREGAENRFTNEQAGIRMITKVGKKWTIREADIEIPGGVA